MASGDAYDVFVSYARSDGDAAAELNGWLHEQGFSTFFDRSALRAGLRWVPALEDAIGRSKAVAILVGPHGIGNTQQYERELALVRQTGDAAFPVIPVLMPGCDSPPTGFLQLLTWVDLSRGRNVREQTDSLEALRAALRGEQVAASAVRASICPYRGLEPFREEDAAFFCGRDDAVLELVARVQAHAFVAVVGPSGSGKSSLVFAGLLPKLREDRREMWDVVSLRPGKWPLRSVAEAFGTAPDAGPAAVQNYFEGEVAAYRSGATDMLAGIVDRRLDAAPEKPDRLLIYVDQWEELYAMAPAPEEDTARLAQHSADVEKFIELLVAAASGARSRASVVVTVRADFYNPLIRNARLAALLPKQQVNIPPMSRDDLRSAIERPAKTAGLSFAPPKLVDRILDDVGTEEGRLPLLQFALKETWQKREGDKLTAEAYTEVGGVAGAIEKTAEEAYERLTPAQKDAARRLFLSLVTPGEGQADIRARGVIPDDPHQREIINLFANPKTRLLVTGLASDQGAGPAGDARATVEVAHEALIRRWPTLREWVRTNRQKLRDRTAILRAKAEWEERGKNEKFLLDPGVQLERGRALLDNPGDVAVDDIRDYVGRSIEKDQRRLDAEREAAVADQKRIADARKRTAEVALAGLVVALVVAAAAVWQYFRATEATRIARQSAEEVVKLVGTDLRGVHSIRVDTLKRLLESARDSVDRLASSLKGDLQFQQFRAEMMSDFGVTYLKAKGLDEARTAFEESLQIFRDLERTGGETVAWKRGIADQTDNVGLVLQQQGQFDAALEYFRRAQELRQDLYLRPPDVAIASNDLSISYYNVGEALMTQQKANEALAAHNSALEYARKALALIPSSPDYKLRISLIHFSLAEDYRALGREDELRASNRAALAIREELIKSDPNNAEWKRLLAWAYQWVGNDLLDGHDPDSALTYFQRCFKLRESLAQIDPLDLVAKYDLAWGYYNMGLVRKAKRQYAEAEDSFTQSLRIQTELTESDPSSKRWHKDLGLSNEQLGDTAAERGDWARALERYRQARTIFQSLVDEAPSNTSWRNRLVAILEKIARAETQNP